MHCLSLSNGFTVIHGKIMFVYNSILLIIAVLKCAADLPVSCDFTEVVGAWRLSLCSSGTLKTISPMTPLRNSEKCIPDDILTLILSSSVSANQRSFVVFDSFGVPVGTWFMMYDQGFEVVLTSPRPINLLAYSGFNCVDEAECAAQGTEYSGRSTSTGQVPGYVSMCGTTHAGYYRSTSGEYDVREWYGDKLPNDQFQPSPPLLPMRTRTIYDHPVEFNVEWELNLMNFDFNVFSQGDCGSYYVMTSTYVLYLRTLKLLGLSPEILGTPRINEIVHNNPYNQGCNGGLELLSFRYAQEVGIPLDGGSTLHPLLRASSYSLLRPTVRAVDPVEILDELYRHGPVAAAIQVAHYQGSPSDARCNPIFSPPTIRFRVEDGSSRDWKPETPLLHHGSLRSGREWRYLDHSIAIFGWGFDQKAGSPFYLVRDFASMNVFKLPMGINFRGIESHITVVYPESSNWKQPENSINWILGS